jgi:serine/threonine protein kinase
VVIRRLQPAAFVVARAAALFALLVVTGCAPAPGDLAITRWSMLSPAPATIDLPAHIERLLADRPATYTLAASVPLTPELTNHDLVFSFADLPTLATLRVNGALALRNEDVLSERYRGRGPIAWHVPASATTTGSLALELTVDNTWVQSAWIETAPRLSARPHGDPWYVFVRSWNDGATVGALCTLTPIGFTYLLMFVLDRRRIAHGWFAIQALLASVLPLFQLGVSQVAFGVYDAPVLAVSISGAAIGSVYFTHAHFGLPRPSRFWPILMATILVASTVWSAPFVATKAVGPIIVVMFQIVAIHQILLLGRLSRRRPRPLNTLTFFISWLGLGFTAGGDCMAWLGLGEKLGGLHGASFGLAFFGVLQSLALSREHVVSLRRSDELNTQLQARVGELEVHQSEIAGLNEELRRQIAERSGQLADALARLGSSEAPKPVRLQPGDVMKDRYEIVRELGAGAMGTVYEVVRRGDRKRFAMKVLSGLSGALDMARFAREAQLASHVAHPNVVTIVDIDVANSGLIYIVMELVDGPSLLGLKARYGDRRFAVEVLLQLAEGLAAIHEMGIVHRDLKPANVLIKQDATGLLVKITDFGVSTIAENASVPPPKDEEPVAQALASGRRPTLPSSSEVTIPQGQRQAMAPSQPDTHEDLQTPSRLNASPLTETGALLGTPIYMAPELAWGAKNAKPPCDIFSLGVIAHELLLGKRPWTESPAFARLEGASVAPAEPLASLCPGLDPTLGDTLDSCLSSNPELRPSARELAAALRAGLHHAVRVGSVN